MSMDIKFPEGTALHPIMFQDRLIENGGCLPPMKGAHACWYFCRVAFGHLERFDQGAVYEGEMDQHNALFNLAKSIALMYELETPDDFLRFIPQVKAEAKRTGKPWDSRLEDPFNIRPLPRIIQ